MYEVWKLNNGTNVSGQQLGTLVMLDCMTTCLCQKVVSASLFCGCSKCFIGAVFCLFIKNTDDE
jgi:hypothetical protein